MGDFFCSSLKFQFSRKFSANHVLTYQFLSFCVTKIYKICRKSRSFTENISSLEQVRRKENILSWSAVLFPSVRLLVVHPHNTRRRTLTVAVTHPGTNAHNCSLTSRSDHTTIFPLGHRYSSKSKWLDTYRYSDSQLPSLCKPERKLHSPKATLVVLYRTKLN